MLATGTPKRLFYDLLAPSDYLLGYGKGCAGQLWILLEALGPDLSPVKRQQLLQVAEPPDARAVALIHAAGPALADLVGTRLVIDRHGDETGLPEASPLARHEHALQQHLRAALLAGWDAGKPANGRWQDERGAVEYVCHYLDAPKELLLFGAGPDAIPVARFAVQLGWGCASSTTGPPISSRRISPAPASNSTSRSAWTPCCIRPRRPPSSS